ncbi:hypothetical protein ACOMICROBIO_NCLOACGD_00658 [Vibrio sp. B1ASS3]|nr:hypothetical protein ACOMICROBIO_NCLOACGD_00658 [Vibrio sp. B1ASS3]CAE6887045.1 hypothetical protein ACOMICROBIO_NCLOACGD_00658 [Vibrio sp. B1ASS3]
MHKTLSKVNILIPRLLIPDVTNPKQNIPSFNNFDDEFLS